MNITGAIPENWTGQIGSISPINVINGQATYECPTAECSKQKTRNLNVKPFGRWSPWCSTAHYQRDYSRINRVQSHHLVGNKVQLKTNRINAVHN